MGVKEFLQENSGGDFEKFSFDQIGDGIVGEIVNTPRLIDTQFGQCMVIDIKPESGGEPRTVFVGSGPMARAISKALEQAGQMDLQPQKGARLGIQFTETRPSKTAGFNDAKLYQALYEKPSPAGASMESLFNRTPGEGQAS